METKMFYSINFSQLNKLDLTEIFEPVKQSYMENYEEKKVFTNVIGFGFFKNGNFIVIACFHDNSKSGNLNLPKLFMIGILHILTIKQFNDDDDDDDDGCVYFYLTRQPRCVRKGV